MSKRTGVILAIVCVLLAVQTWRLHVLRLAGTAAEESLASGTANPESANQPMRSGDSSAESETGLTPTLAAGSVLHPSTTERKDALTAFREFAQDSAKDGRSNRDSPDARSDKKQATRQNAQAKSGSGPEANKKNGDQAAAEREKTALRNGLARARAAAKDGDYDKALDLLNSLIDSTENNGPAYQALASMYRDMGLPEDALAVLQEWSNAQPDAAAAHLELANTYEALGLNAEALAELQLYEDLSGGSGDSYSELAAMYRRLGMTGQEGQSLSAWLDTNPDSPQAMRAMADYYRRNGDYAGAVAQYQAVLLAEPGNIPARTNLAQTYQQMGQYPAAQAEYRAALELTPGDANLWLRLGESYRRSGDLASAIGSFQSVVALEPGSTAALRANRQITRLQRQLSQQTT
jgi:tetratricopeptide (TPR) repeat protein